MNTLLYRFPAHRVCIIVEWIKSSNNVFYAWHYGDLPQSIERMQWVSREWNVPTFGTELNFAMYIW